MRTLDAFVFSSACASAVGAALCLATGLALAGRLPLHAAALAFSGTFLVYNIDRLRDLERDRGAHPLRTEFVELHRHAIGGLCGLAALAAFASGWSLGPPAWLLCGVVLVPGLLHRRLKGAVLAKTIYVAAAWVLVVVGLAAIDLGRSVSAALPWGWPAALLAGPIAANLVASNLTELTTAKPPGSRSRWLRLAAALAALSTAAALFAPEPFRPLAWVGAAELVSLAFYRSGERYLGAALDGALLAGAALALLAA